MRPRDLIVSVFLEQGRPLDAVELSTLVRGLQPGIGRATLYRALRWMVDAGVAKKIDGVSGRTRYGQAAQRAPLLPLRASETTNLVAARDALRIAVATSDAARGFFASAASVVPEPPTRALFHRLADDERTRLAGLDAQQRALLLSDPDLDARPTSCFLRGSAVALYAAGAQEVGSARDARTALMIAIRCTRRSHRFFIRAAEHFADAVATGTFMAFAEVEQAHLDTLVHEYRVLAGPRPRRLEPRARDIVTPIVGRRLRGRP